MARPTMEDVAREAGVSRALVSLVFRDMPHVSDRRREAVLAAADRLGYRLDAVARRLAAKHSGVIGVVWNDPQNPIFAETIDQLQGRAEDQGYRMIFGAGKRESPRERIAIETLLEHRPDGLILLGAQLSDEALGAIAEQVPLALVSTVVRHPLIDCFVVDEVRGAGLAIAHLAELGHRRIAHVDGGKGAGAKGRRDGYRQAMAKAGLRGQIEVIPGFYGEEAGSEAARQLLAMRDRPTAVFAANDLIALGLLSELRANGVRVPEDVSIVGFDDSPLARLYSIGLTSIAQTMTNLGAHAFDAVLERIADPQKDPTVAVVTPHLVVRTTTGVCVKA